MAQAKQYNNKLGILGWVFGGRWGIERFAFSLHRLTGLGLVSYFLLHIFVTSSRLLGKDVWESTMGFLSHPFFKIGELFLYFAFVFHAINGIRLILIELGLVVGKAEEPIYPYQSSINTQRPLFFVCMVIAALFVLLGGYNFLIVNGHIFGLNFH